MPLFYPTVCEKHTWEAEADQPTRAALFSSAPSTPAYHLHPAPSGAIQEQGQMPIQTETRTCTMEAQINLLNAQP